ncbi:MAG TPA: DNA starvation/stationary phase protection protein [Novosphingobium sp.]|jgi:starvation-inducible DNA-binding protein|nr:DNA starvation/stationary phase protection protein [Novosphingobium sp.]HPZ47313.1 DNA starvation/stationary phase protection protein [Novosphingobium sp.]
MPSKSTDNAQAALTGSLNALLADLFALYLKTKNFHWHVRGPRFRDLHLLFDEQATEIFALTDLVAERVRKNGAVTLTSIQAVGTASRIAPQDDAGLDAEAMIAELAADNRQLIGWLRETKAAASAAGDNATDGAIDDWTDQAEQRAWFLESLLA